MKNYLSAVLGYYGSTEDVPLFPGDIEVPERPSPDHDWDGEGWVLNPARGKESAKARLAAAVQAHLDGQALQLGYDSIFTAVTYATEPAVPKFQREGLALRTWRSLVWAACYQILADVDSGARIAPTEAEVIGLLPTFQLEA